MIQGLYAAASGMLTVEKRQDVIANNIANAATAGFRRQDAIHDGFHPLIMSRLRHPARFNMTVGPGGGSNMFETFTDVRSGAIQKTGNGLNVALQGPGFLAVDTPEGERYTRNGAFAVDVAGNLVTADGHAVLGGRGGGIEVGGGVVHFGSRGEVYSNDELVGTLRLVEFEDPRVLVRQGESLYLAPDGVYGENNGNTRVEGGSLEMSNVQLPVEMANMTLGLRAYAANQKVIQAIDDTVSGLIQRIGMQA